MDRPSISNRGQAETGELAIEGAIAELESELIELGYSADEASSIAQLARKMDYSERGVEFLDGWEEPKG